MTVTSEIISPRSASVDTQPGAGSLLPMPTPAPELDDGAAFHTTRWSLIAGRNSAPENRQLALDWLCRSYWKPLYRHVRGRGQTHADALDLTQGFFALLLEGEPFAGAEQSQGRFRAWLLAALNHYLSDQRDHATAKKRGGGCVTLSLDEMNAVGSQAWEPSDPALPPDQMFDRGWAMEVMDQALEALAQDYTRRGAANQFVLIKPFLTSRTDSGGYDALALQLNTTTNSVAVAVKRLRERFREQVRAVVRDTVGSEAELENEMSHLFAALRGA